MADGTPTQQQFTEVFAKINATAEEINNKLTLQNSTISETRDKINAINTILGTKRRELADQIEQTVRDGNAKAHAELTNTYAQLQKLQERMTAINNTEGLNPVEIKNMTTTLNIIEEGIKNLGTGKEWPPRDTSSMVAGVPTISSIASGGRKRKTKKRRKRGGYTYKKSPTRKLVTKSKRKHKRRTPKRR